MAMLSNAGVSSLSSAFLLLLLHVSVDFGSSRPAILPNENLCVSGEDAILSWTGGIIPYNLSDALAVDTRRDFMESMASLEKSFSRVIFLPRKDQEKFLHIIPGERCCLERETIGIRQRNLYINDSCVDDRSTLESLIDAQKPTTTSSQVQLGQASSPANDGNQNRCGDYIHPLLKKEKGGRIHSPGYPLNYPIGSECVWKFRVPENHVLHLIFHMFHTECHYDFLEIFQLTDDGSIYNYTNLCGLQPDTEFITTHITASTVVIRFHADETYSHRGFNITYEFKENTHKCHINNGGCNETCAIDINGMGVCKCQSGYEPNRRGRCKDVNECLTRRHGCTQLCRNTKGSYFCDCQQGYGLSLDRRTCNRCGWTSNHTSGIIQSPGHPGIYLHQQNCRWTIVMNPGHMLKLTIPTLDIAPSANCTTEFLKLEYGYFGNNGRLCGFYDYISYYVLEANFTSTNIRFRSRAINTQYAHSGFRIKFQQVPIHLVSAEEANRVRIGNRIIPYKPRHWLERDLSV